MEGMNASNLTSLADMLKREEEEVPSQTQMVTPASLGVSAVTPATTAKKQTRKQAQSEPGDIWNVEEVPDKIDIVVEKDSRKRPWYDILYKQSVSAMDAFGSGLTGNHPGSDACNQIVVKVKFPGHKMKDLVRNPPAKLVFGQCCSVLRGLSHRFNLFS